MVFEEIHVPAKQDPEPLIKSCLRDGAERVTMGQAGNNLVYANSAGHGVLEDLENLKKQIAILMAKDEGRASQIVQHQQQIVQHQQQIASLEKQVSRLSQSSEGYLAIRRRFLDVYKRDIKGMEEVKGNKAIREGNIIAHEGDALGDAALFDRDQRTDRRVYRELYGLDHQQVLEFRTYTDGLFNTS